MLYKIIFNSKLGFILETSHFLLDVQSKFALMEEEFLNCHWLQRAPLKKYRNLKFHLSQFANKNSCSDEQKMYFWTLQKKLNSIQSLSLKKLIVCLPFQKCPLCAYLYHIKMRCSITQKGATTLSITTFSIMWLSRKGFFGTLRINGTQHTLFLVQLCWLLQFI